MIEPTQYSTVQRVRLDFANPQMVEVPHQAELLRVGEYPSKQLVGTHIYCWYRARLGEIRTDKYEVHIVEDDHIAPNNAKYLGSVLTENGHLYHVFAEPSQ